MVNNYRFIKEYANYLKKCINDNDLMLDTYKKDRIEKIDKILSYVYAGLITVDECMLTLSRL